MSYESEEVRCAQEIFYYLLEHHELGENDMHEHYKQYTENSNVQALVKMQAQSSNCTAERYSDTIYLIPHEDNSFLGFSKAQLKKLLCKSGAVDRDYYLAVFAILVLLVEFYDGQGSSSKTRDYIKVGELQNSISTYLSEGVNRSRAAKEETMGKNDGGESILAFEEMMRAYESLRSDDRMSRQKTTKEGFLYTILKFLQDQGLIIYVEQDEMIISTPKLDRFMDWNLLNKNNYNRVLRAMGVVDEQD